MKWVKSLQEKVMGEVQRMKLTCLRFFLLLLVYRVN
jgi:hypothetical protein